MINGFLQFLKKQKLAIQLAKEDMLFLLYPLEMFQATLPLSRFFIKKSAQSPAQRVERYIAAHHDTLLSLYATTLALSYNVQPPRHTAATLKGDMEIKHALSPQDYSLGEELLPELVSSNPKLDETYLLDTLTLNSDMRLYGAELSEVQNFASECGGNLSLPIDWQHTSSDKLFVVFAEETTDSMNLPQPAQQNLAKIFFHLLYHRAYLVLDWQSILYNHHNEILWRDFSVIRNLTKEQLKYALQYALNNLLPKNADEYNIKRALDLLRFYCPQVNLAELSKQMGASLLADFKTHDEEWSKKNAPHLKTLNAGDGHARTLLPNQNLYNRLKSKPLPTHLGKSSLYYWGPLILAAFLLYYFL